MAAKKQKVSPKVDITEVESLALKQYQEAKNYYDTNTRKTHEYYWNLYNSVRKKTPNAGGWRTNNFVPITFAAIQTEMARFMDGLVGPDGTQFYRMSPKLLANEPSSDAITKILGTHMQKGGFYQAIYSASLNAHIFGVGIIEQVWNSGNHKFSYMKTKGGDNIETVDVDENYDEPIWNAPSTMDVWWDPNASPFKKDITYVVKRQYIRTSELKLQKNLWNVQDNYKYVLANNMSTNNELDSDPVIELLTVYTKKSITTLVYNKAIRYVKNPYANQQIPFYFIVRYPDFYRFGGKGIAAILMDLQEAENDIYNLTMDNVKLSVNKVFKKRADAEIYPQALNIEPGKIISLNDINNDLQMMDMGSVHMDAFKMIDTISGMVNQATGSLDYLNSPTGIGAQNKTAAGARIIVQEANRRFAMAIKYNKETFLEPMLADLLSLYRQYIDRGLVAELFAEHELQAMKITPDKIDWDGKYDFEISGNTSLLDKQAILENLQTALPMLSQLGAKINTEAVCDQILDALDLPKDIVSGFTNPQAQGSNGAPNAGPANGQSTSPPPQGSDVGPEGQAPAPAGPATNLSPDQEAQITQIAGILGTKPEILIQDISEGRVNMQTLVAMAQKAQGSKIAPPSPNSLPEQQ
jgi:hypothetical protein